MIAPELRLMLAAGALLVAWLGGMWVMDAIEAKKELREVKAELLQLKVDAAHADALAADKIHDDAAVDRGVSKVLDTNQEEARRDPEYREYLDRPLPAQSKRLYARAAAELASAGLESVDRAGAAADEEDHRAGE